MGFGLGESALQMFAHRPKTDPEFACDLRGTAPLRQQRGDLHFARRQAVGFGKGAGIDVGRTAGLDQEHGDLVWGPPVPSNLASLNGITKAVSGGRRRGATGATWSASPM